MSAFSLVCGYFLFYVMCVDVICVYIFQYDIAKAELDLYLSSEQKELTKLEQIKSNYESASKTVEGRKE